MSYLITQQGVTMKVVKVLLLGTLVSLVGCSGEPSDGDINDAINKQYEQQIERSAGLLNEDSVKINSIKKVGCVEAEGQQGYNCDVEVDIVVKVPFAGEQKQKGVNNFRLVETDDGWSLAQ
jgi:hypothetical protein